MPPLRLLCGIPPTGVNLLRCCTTRWLDMPIRSWPPGCPKQESKYNKEVKYARLMHSFPSLSRLALISVYCMFNFGGRPCGIVPILCSAAIKCDTTWWGGLMCLPMPSFHCCYLFGTCYALIKTRSIPGYGTSGGMLLEDGEALGEPESI